jgi:hypothetical protein
MASLLIPSPLRRHARRCGLIKFDDHVDLAIPMAAASHRRGQNHGG